MIGDVGPPFSRRQLADPRRPLLLVGEQGFDLLARPDQQNPGGIRCTPVLASTFGDPGRLDQPPQAPGVEVSDDRLAADIYRVTGTYTTRATLQKALGW